jgi:hypothetical protein
MARTGIGDQARDAVETILHACEEIMDADWVKL